MITKSPMPFAVLLIEKRTKCWVENADVLFSAQICKCSPMCSCIQKDINDPIKGCRHSSINQSTYNVKKHCWHLYVYEIIIDNDK